jgi:hypothetical protein
MTEAYHANSTGGANCDDKGAAAALGIAKWLCLAATPTFAIMALMTSVLGGGPMDMLCSAGHGSPLTGMVPMYLLMSAFHSAPWLKLVSSRRSGGRRFRVGSILRQGEDRARRRDSAQYMRSERDQRRFGLGGERA